MTRLDGLEVCRDPADDKFLAAAIAGGAQYIVSEDKDRLDLGNYAGSYIVTTEAFLRALVTGDKRRDSVESPCANYHPRRLHHVAR